MFKQIEVSNFKSLKYLDYKCCKLNILTGLNGSGKSSFIQALIIIKDFFPWASPMAISHLKVRQEILEHNAMFFILTITICSCCLAVGWMCLTVKTR